MSSTKPVAEASSASFFGRHEFLLRRLHSLSGVLPVGAYMVVHLLTNSTIMEGVVTFQRGVNTIHSLPVLVVVEWLFIFLPILFHAFYGILIIRDGLPNHSTYKYGSNYRYSFQRMTGMIAFFFIAWHVFHMHGWFHAEWWEKMAHGVGGANFKPFNAASTAGKAMQMNILVPILYTIGVLACVFHLANGVWTFGITWGLWTTQAAQNRAGKWCTAFGVGLAFVSMAPIFGFTTLDVKKAKEIEDKMLAPRIESGEVDPNSPKIDRSAAHEPAMADAPKVGPSTAAD